MTEKNSESRANTRALDRVDRLLLSILQEEGRTRLEDLARRVELAPSSVHDRLRRLQREGVIRRWTIAVSPEDLGLSVLAFVGVQASRPCSELVGALEQIREIEEFHSVAGQLSFILKLRAANTEHLLQLIERLKQIPGIDGTETTVVLKTHLERGPIVTGV
ncbi:MAG TPA: Lrp/AsnC family transcriptional regulator [Ktedonobacterales bacterium]